MNPQRVAIAAVLFLNLFILTETADAQRWGRASATHHSTDLTCAAASADGKKVVACSDNETGVPPGGQVYTSTNGGVTWQTTSVTSNWWLSVASSTNGSQLVAGALNDGNDGLYYPGGLYISRDSGVTWAQSLGNVGTFSCLASSADGTHLVTAGQGLGPFGIYYSTDSGNSWNAATGDGTTNDWGGLATSADGVKMVAVGTDSATGSHGHIYRSANSGANWSPIFETGPLNSIASSANGTNLVAVGIAGTFTSADAGSTWHSQPGAPNMSAAGGAVACSADGTRLVAGAAQGLGNKIYVSLDSGVTWMATTNSPTFGARYLVSSTNGARLVAVEYSGSSIYTMNPALTVTGHVFCVCNSNGIANATVQIGTNVLTTDTNGAYCLTNAIAQNYPFGAAATNYTTLITNLVVASDALGITNDVYLTNNFFVIYPFYDDSILANPDVKDLTNFFWMVTQIYTNYITDPICVQIQFYAAASGLAESISGKGFIPYSQYVSDLQAVTNKSANDNIALASLNPPPYTGILSNSTVRMTAALLDAMGEHEAAQAARIQGVGLDGKADGKIGIYLPVVNIDRSDPVATNYDMQATTEHEIDEVLGVGGAGSYLKPSENSPLGSTNGVGVTDLYRYATNGVHSYTYTNNAAPYFSLDGGATPLVNFNQYGSGSDYGDWGDGVKPADGHGHNPPQVQDAFGTPGRAYDLGANELIALDVVGYTLSPGTMNITTMIYGASNFRFNFSSVPGQTYQVQYSSSLNGNSWQNLGGPVTAKDVITTVTDNTVDGGTRFYRLASVPSGNGGPAPHIAVPHTHAQPGEFNVSPPQKDVLLPGK